MRLIEQREVSFDAGSQRRLEERLERLARQDDPVWNGYVQSDEPRQRACLSTSGTLVYGVGQRNHPARHAALAFPPRRNVTTLNPPWTTDPTINA